MCLLVNIFLLFSSAFCHKNFRGKCSSIEMLKEHTARESLRTPGLVKLAFLLNVAVSLCTSLCSAKTLIFHGCKIFVAGLLTV